MARKVNVSAPNGTAWMSIAEGIVTHLDTKRWSDTRVGSNAAYVHSSVTQRQEAKFWIREADGTERDFTFTDSGFSLAPGHKVRIAWGANVNNDRGDYLFAHNFNSGQTWSFHKNDWHDWCAREGLAIYNQPQGSGCSGCLFSVPISFTALFWWIAVVSSDNKISLLSKESFYCLLPFLFFVALWIINSLIYARRDAKTLRQLESQKSLASDFYHRMQDEFNKSL